MCVHGKRIENRQKPPPEWMLGRYVALHAGTTFDEGAVEALRADGYAMASGYQEPHCVTTGAIVAVACLRRWICGANGCPETQRRWWVGPYGWVFDDFAVLPTPVPLRGQRGFEELSDEHLAEVLQQWGKVGG